MYPANSQYLSVLSNPALQTGNVDFTLGAWVYLNKNTSPAALISKWDAANITKEYRLLFNPTPNRVQFVCTYNGTNNTTVTGNTFNEPPVGSWFFMLAWHDATNDQLGIQGNNGTADTVAFNSAGVYVSNNPFVVGGLANTEQILDGRMTGVFLTKRLLTSDEKTWLYNSGTPRDYSEIGQAGTDGSNLYTGLVGWWDLIRRRDVELDSHGENHLITNGQ